MTTIFTDFREGIARWPLWTALAWDDIRNTYRRTAIGVAWYSRSFAFLVGAKLVIFGQINPESFAQFAVYLAVGFLAWELLAAIVMEGCTVFTGAANWISGVKLPFSVYIFRSLTRISIQLTCRLIPVVTLFVLLQQDLTWGALSALPALGLIAFAGFFVQLLLGTMCVRHRDIQHLVSNGIRVLFFLSPVVWTMDQLGRIGYWLWYNPFYHLIEIIRSPILDGAFPAQSWLYVLVFTGLIAPLGIWAFAATRRQIPFWV